MTAVSSVPGADVLSLLGGATYVRAGRLLTPHGWSEDVTVRIEGGRIRAADISGHEARDASVIDASDHYVIPGLVDAHVHLAVGSDTKREGPVRARSNALDLLRVGIEIAALLRGGVTTVRAAGGEPSDIPIALRENIIDGLFAAPRIVSTGTAVRPARGSAAAASSLQAMRRNFGLFADAATLGGCDVRRRRWSPSELRVLVAEGRRRGVRVGLRALDQREALDGLRAGVDVLEGIPRGANGPLLRALARTKAILVPVVSGECRPQASPSRALSFVRHAHRAGCRIAVGSGWRPGEGMSFANEILALLEAGVDAVSIVRAATVHSAMALGLAADIGSIAEGTSADLIVLDADPLLDPQVLASPAHVIRVLQDPDPLLS